MTAYFTFYTYCSVGSLRYLASEVSADQMPLPPHSSSHLSVVRMYCTTGSLMHFHLPHHQIHALLCCVMLCCGLCEVDSLIADYALRIHVNRMKSK